MTMYTIVDEIDVSDTVTPWSDTPQYDFCVFI